jgi:hypothetical protein
MNKISTLFRNLMKGKFIFLIPMGLALVIFLIPIFFTLPGRSLLWGEIQNFGHTPLTGTLALLMLWISRLLFGSKIRRPAAHYNLAFLAAISLGGAIEIAQIFLPGDPDWFDFLRDTLGAGAFLCFFAAFDPKLKLYYHRRTLGILKLPLIISGLLMIIAIIPGIIWVSAYIHKYQIAPYICDFNSALEMKFIDTKDARLTLVHPPAQQWKKSDEDLVGQLDLNPIGYPGFTIIEPGDDWGKYKYFSFEIFSPLDTVIVLHLVIEDYTGQDIDEDRFNKSLGIKPGLNEIRVPIKEIQNGPVSRKLELAAIRDLYLYTFEPKTTIRLLIDNIKLTI